MISTYERIVELCHERGIKPGRVCSDTGLSRAILSDLKAGRTKELSAKNTKIIADYLGVTTDYLLGVEPDHVDWIVSDPVPLYTDCTMERVRKLCEEHEITLDQLEKEVGFSRGSIHYWEDNAPKIVAVMPIADYFHVSLDYLIGRSEIKSTAESLTNDTHFNSLLRIWENLTEDEKEYFEIMLRLGFNPKHITKQILSFLDNFQNTEQLKEEPKND